MEITAYQSDIIWLDNNGIRYTVKARRSHATPHFGTGREFMYRIVVAARDFARLPQWLQTSQDW
jgi:hypothetical protein